MTKRQAVYILKQAAEVYKDQILSQNLLIIYGNPERPSWISTKADARNFYHLTGVTINKANILKDYDGKETNELVVFYEKALRNKLSEKDFDFKDEHTVQKLNVIVQTLNIGSNASMIGDYGGWRINLKSNKLTGGQNSFLGLIKNGNFYVPNTIMADDIRKNSPNTERVLAVLSKKIMDKEYNTIRKIAKKIDFPTLLDKIKDKVPIDEKLFNHSSNGLSAAQINKISYTPISYNGGAAVLSPTSLGENFRSIIDNVKNNIFGNAKKRTNQPPSNNEEELRALKEMLFCKDEEITQRDKIIAEKNEEIAKKSDLADKLIKALETITEEKNRLSEKVKNRGNKIHQINLWLNDNPDVKERLIKDKKERRSAFASSPTENSDRISIKNSDISNLAVKQTHKSKNKKSL